ncbi:CoA transferase [Polaromonas sp. SM01]|uniref:CoA transferase n=1 Tax=Polaromonas sp. SM01 TaxID=3085630 RepID=UPI0029812F7F|nr:CoA transferase [Polaromonas sp. SM01]MDW5444923.1 CoA transferase [Polaromonas sp. SM01]
MTPHSILEDLWRAAQLPPEALAFTDLSGADPVFPSSFRVGAAAQSTIAAAALAACEVGHQRGAARQRVAVEMAHAAVECTGWFSIDGQTPEVWDVFSGLYRCADGHVRIHTNFAHHREGALRLLGLNPATAQRRDAEKALLGWRARDFEEATAKQHLVATALRSFDEWDATPQGLALRTQPLFTIERIGDPKDATPLTLPPLRDDALPLSGVRVLDLTRILAGPVGGRALAAYGADVMLINSPNLPNIDAIADTSRGKLSAHADLHTAQGRAALEQLLGDAHVFVQGYRPGGLQALGYGSEEIARLRPGIVYVSLSAYGTQGPWAERRGFDSLVQTAMGFNHAEGQAAGDGVPRPMPMQILDEATGYLIAFGAAAALWRQQREGGSWHVQVSLAQTGQWLRNLGRVPGGLAAARPPMAPYLEVSPSGFGTLCAVRHSAQLARTPAKWARPSMPPGSSAPAWP